MIIIHEEMINLSKAYYFKKSKFSIFEINHFSIMNLILVKENYFD